MCRLYGFRANEPTKVECTLVYAQNALMVQSCEDMAGYEHAQGWGIATYEDHCPHVERQTWAAYRGEHFQRAAARIFSRQVLAHVRRATVGPPKIENTHPFVDGPWAFIHNGTVPSFDRLQSRLLALLPEQRRNAIHGDTDSEHVFPLSASLAVARAGARSFGRAAPRASGRFWNGATRSSQRKALASTSFSLTASRWSAAASDEPFITSREGVHDCEICGFPHIYHDPHRRYR